MLGWLVLGIVPLASIVVVKVIIYPQPTTIAGSAQILFMETSVLNLPGTIDLHPANASQYFHLYAGTEWSDNLAQILCMHHVPCLTTFWPCNGRGRYRNQRRCVTKSAPRLFRESPSANYLHCVGISSEIDGGPVTDETSGASSELHCDSITATYCEYQDSARLAVRLYWSL